MGGRGEEVFLLSVYVHVCVRGLIDSTPSKSRLCAPLPQLHLANEKHHYATSTATPLRAKMWEREESESKGGGSEGGRAALSLSLSKAGLFAAAEGRHMETN